MPVDLFRVDFINVVRPTGGDGSIGPWPDPLIPQRDFSNGERRRAFPVDVALNHTQPIWVEVCVPINVPAARYTGVVHLRAKAKPIAEVPISLLVRAFAIPATSSIAMAFGFSALSASRGHRGAITSALLAPLTRAYAKDALAHRLSLFGGTQSAPEWRFDGHDARIDWTAHDAEVAPFLDGTALANGARWTAVDLRAPVKFDSDAARAAFFRAYAAHYRARGWLARLFYFPQDEPPPVAASALRQTRARVHQADPALRMLVTASATNPFNGVADIWVPLINCFHPNDTGCAQRLARSAYDALEKSGAALWWYQSCASHGCDGGRKSSSWPSYAIDRAGTFARIMGWLDFNERVAGELYYDVVYSYDNNDPWQNVNSFGGNGDGTLYYPGTPERFGGTTDFPVESQRLKNIRDGLEDFEYLKLCAARHTTRAQSVLRTVVRSPWEWEADPRILLQAREQLAACIESE